MNPNLLDGPTLGDILEAMLAEAFGKANPDAEDDGFITVYSDGKWFE